MSHNILRNDFKAEPQKDEIRIFLVRQKSDEFSTLGKLYFNGQVQCYSLENAYHDTKIKGMTRIPKGTYSLSLRCFGGFHARYSKRYCDGLKLNHKGMIEIDNVRDFTDILFHPGNSHKDTEGCILMGEKYQRTDDGYKVLSSRKAYEKIYPMITQMVLDHQSVILEIIDLD